MLQEEPPEQFRLEPQGDAEWTAAEELRRVLEPHGGLAALGYGSDEAFERALVGRRKLALEPSFS